jgi:hypothetical protein
MGLSLGVVREIGYYLWDFLSFEIDTAGTKFAVKLGWKLSTGMDKLASALNLRLKQSEYLLNS